MPYYKTNRTISETFKELKHLNRNDSQKETEIHNEGKSPALDLKNAATKAEYETIMSVLQKVNFNKKKAAELLNIDRKTLYNKIKNFQD